MAQRADGLNDIFEHDVTVRGNLKAQGVTTGNLGIGGGDGTNIAGSGSSVAGNPSYTFCHQKASVIPFSIVDGIIPYRILATSLGGANQKMAGEFIFGGDFAWVILNDNLSTKLTPISFSMNTGLVKFNTASQFNSSMQVANLTTAQRDALTPANGMIIYNITTNAFNFYENGAWVTGSGLA